MSWQAAAPSAFHRAHGGLGGCGKRQEGTSQAQLLQGSRGLGGACRSRRDKGQFEEKLWGWCLEQTNCSGAAHLQRSLSRQGIRGPPKATAWWPGGPREPPILPRREGTTPLLPSPALPRAMLCAGTWGWHGRLSPCPTRRGDTTSATSGGEGGGMEREEAGEREAKEKNEFCWRPSGAAIDREQAGVERC